MPSQLVAEQPGSAHSTAALELRSIMKKNLCKALLEATLFLRPASMLYWVCPQNGPCSYSTPGPAQERAPWHPTEGRCGMSVKDLARRATSPTASILFQLSGLPTQPVHAPHAQGTHTEGWDLACKTESPVLPLTHCFWSQRDSCRETPTAFPIQFPETRGDVSPIILPAPADQLTLVQTALPIK